MTPDQPESKPPPDEAASAVPREVLAGLDDVLITDELDRRPNRDPDHEASALSELARELSASPGTVLQRLVDLIVERDMAGSAGISILRPHETSRTFHWAALAGAWAEHLGGTMPFEASPCGVVVSRDAHLLFARPHALFPAANVDPLIHEILLVPFHVRGAPVGTLWVIAHEADRVFDREDLRLLTQLARFASAAYQTVTALDEAQAARQMLEQRVAERTRALTQANAVLREREEMLAVDLANAERLRDLADLLVTEENAKTIYDEILFAAMAVAGADAGTVQIYDDRTKSLALLASRNLSRTITAFYDHVDAGSRSACGDALKAGKRAFVDFPDEDADAGCRLLVDEGLQSALALPLVSRTGAPLGMLNTHWRRPRHRPTERQLHLLELLARQAADLIDQRQAQRTLRDSERRFRALVMAGAYILYRMSADWRRMHRLVGRDLLADTLEPVEDWKDTYLLPEDRPMMDAAIAAAIATKSLFEHEHRVRSADGGVGWVLTRAVPLLNDDGEIVEWFGVDSDITERREAQDRVRRAEEAYRDALERQVRERTIALAASHDLLQATLDSSMDMIQVFAAVRDETGEIVDFRWILNNHASETTYGEVRGESLLARQPGVVEEGIFAAFRRVAETGEPDSAERHYVHEQFDGWFYQSAVKLGDGVATTTKDITAWKSAQADVLRLQEEVARTRLRESEERLRQFGEASSDVLWIRDSETLQWNYLTPAFETIYGLDRETALRNDNMAGWLDLIVAEDRQTAIDALARVRTGERVSFEYRILRPRDGEVRWLRDTDFPIRDVAGRVRWFGGVGRDITEQKASVRRQEVLVNELQHRARNLLGVVTAVADRTLRQGGSVDAFEDRLQALSRAQGLLSRHGSDTVAVGAMVRAELAAHMQAGPDRASIGGPEVQLTARQVQNFALALHELTTNAVKYGALKGETGRLAVTWEILQDGRERQRLALDWIESGVAVPPDAPTRRGYGTELIQHGLSYALDAQVTYDLGRDGVRCRIDLPIA